MFSFVKKIKNFAYDYLFSPMFFKIIYFRDLKKIEKVYPNFDKLNKSEINDLTLFYKEEKNVCGELSAEIVKIIDNLSHKSKNIFLDGDTKLIVPQFKKRFGFEKSNVITVGINGCFDYEWNFENDVPKNLSKQSFDLIVSQAMIEHLIDPYKHFKDLASLLNKNGYLIVHTVMPGYNYHRYPVDTLRFFPDWFEEVSKRLNLRIVKKFRRDFNVVYCFQKKSIISA